MTGVEDGSALGNGYNGNWGLGQYGRALCDEVSIDPKWFSAHALSDLLTYRPSNGDTRVRFAGGDGTWDAEDIIDTSSTWDIYPGQFDEDHSTDLLLYDPNAGSGTEWELWLRKPANGGWNTHSDSTDLLNSAVVLPGDLDGDGIDDLVVYRDDVGAGESRVQTLLSDGDGTWTEKSTTDYSNTAGWAMLLGYFDDDNHIDHVHFDPDGTGWKTRFGNGSGGWSFGSSNDWPSASSGWVSLTGYFDADRLTDLIRYDPAGNAQDGAGWMVREANGSGGWTGEPIGYFTQPDRDLWVGYFDNDNLSDIVRMDDSSGDWATKLGPVFENQSGEGAWSGGSSGDFGSGKTIYTAQLGQDERTDIVLYKASNGDTVVRMSEGSGTWAAASDTVNLGANKELYIGFYDRDQHAN